MKFKMKYLFLSFSTTILSCNIANAVPAAITQQASSIRESGLGAAPKNTNTNVSTPTTATSNSSMTASTTSDDKIVLNFENADIQTVIKAISKLSGKNFVVDPRVKGTVTIVSEKPVSKSESYKVLESALRMQGFATVEADGVIKVLPEADARTYGMKMGNQDSSSPGDQLITRVFIIDNGSATQLANTLRPMISPNNSISVYPNSNSIVVTDYASNVARISKIINELNATKTTQDSTTTVGLRYAYAADVAQTLQNYMGTVSGSGGGASGSSDNGPAATVTVDPTSNSIFITSHVASKLSELKSLALKLDQQAAQSNNNLHVVYLRNADAAHVAEVLRVLASGQDNPDLLPSPANRAISDTSSSLGSTGGGGSGGGMGGGSQAPKATQSTSRGSSGATGADKNAAKILIQAEPTTNSLIIQAPEAVYRNFRMVINMLDVRRVQVMIEALIADVNTTEQGNFGIQWVGGAGNNSAGAIALSNYGGGGSSLSSIATTALGIAGGLSGGGTGSPTGISIPNEVYVGLVTGTVNVGGTTIPGISALADMIASTSAGNILGRPTLLTLDNEEASLFVGSNIGLPSGSYATTGGNSTVNPFTTVNRQDLGTVLRLKPLVTQSGAIQLSVFQENSSVDPNNQPTGVFANNGPTILKRNLKTQILVNDGQIIALGGMTSDSIQLQNSGIPLLSSIPYLGWLFSWQARQHVKQNLVIFLRPVIIRNEEGIKALTNQRYRYIMDQQNMIQAKGNLALPRIDAVNIENQVPYNNQIPNQTVTPPAEPIVDLRNSTTQNANKAGQGNGSTPEVNTWTNTGGTTVKQTAPNAVSIINNN